MSDMHTPGPWYVITDDDTDFTAIATAPEISGTMDLDREVLGSSEWLRVKPEDLQLMAAAPTLLDALWQAANLIDALGGDSSQARAEIAKATRADHA